MKNGISCSNISISITLKTFWKHTFQRQIASLLLFCKQGNIFCLLFQEQLNKTKWNNMLSFNPTLSQSRATQSLKNPQICCCSLRLQMSDQVLFFYLQHYRYILVLQKGLTKYINDPQCLRMSKDHLGLHNIQLVFNFCLYILYDTKRHTFFLMVQISSWSVISSG